MEISDIKSHPSYLEISKMIVDGVSPLIISKYLKIKKEFSMIKPKALKNLIKDLIDELSEEDRNKRYENIEKSKANKKPDDKISIVEINPQVSFAIQLTDQLPEIKELQGLVNQQLERIVVLIGREIGGDGQATKMLEGIIEQTIIAISKKFEIRKTILMSDNSEKDLGQNLPAKKSSNILNIDKFQLNIQNLSPEARREAEAKLIPLIQKAKEQKIKERGEIAEGQKR